MNTYDILEEMINIKFIILFHPTKNVKYMIEFFFIEDSYNVFYQSSP